MSGRWEELRRGRPIEITTDGRRYYLDQWEHRIYEREVNSYPSHARREAEPPPWEPPTNGHKPRRREPEPPPEPPPEAEWEPPPEPPPEAWEPLTPPEPEDPISAHHLGVLRSKLLTSDELDKLPPPEPLIENLLLKNSIAVLFGRPGSYKSFIAVDWALSIGTGRGWQGREVQEGKVLYVAAEGGTGMGQRKRAWQHDRHEDDVNGIVWLPIPVSLIDRQWSEALVMLVAEGGYAMVVIDTLSRSMAGADENSPRDMSTVVDNASRIREASGACVLVVHHTPKDGGTIRGHSALEGAADSTFEAQGDNITIKLTVAKQKDLPSGEVILLRAENCMESCVIRSHDGRISGDDLELAEAALMKVAWDCCGTDGLSATELFRVSEMTRTTYYRAKKSLVTRGALVNVGSAKQKLWAPAEEVVK